MMNLFKVWIFGLLTVCSAIGCDKPLTNKTKAPTESEIKEKISKVVNPIIENGWSQSMIVGVSLQGKDYYFPFGKLSSENPKSPDENTVFEIGSITKVFTAIVLADMAEKGEVSLDDPLEKHLPAEFKIPMPGGKPITLASVADHTSGLPNIPANFWEKGDNVFDVNTSGKRWGGYTEAKLKSFFESPVPTVDDSRKYIYSNVGAGTLGHVLQRISGVELETLFIDRICSPLGMNSTSFAKKPTATGHDPDGKPVNFWSKDTSILGGAFALRSTCKDLVAFAKANLTPESTSIAATLKSALAPRDRINELEFTALGWKMNKFGVTYTTGATGGFRCAIFLHPPTKSAIVLMANTQVGGVVGGRATQFDALAGSILNLVVGSPPLKLNFPPLGSNDQDNSDYVGFYRPADGSKDPSFPVHSEEEKLMIAGPGKIEMRLWPKAKDHFFLRQYVSDIKFHRDESGKVTGADIQFEGNRMKLNRFSKP